MIELLVVIAILAVLAGMLLPALGSAKAKAQGIQCLNNHRQLLLAWRLYAEENGDRLPTAMGQWAWVTGEMSSDGNNPSNWDVELDIKKSPLWPYCPSAALWKLSGGLLDRKSNLRPAQRPHRAARAQYVNELLVRR